MHNRFHPPLPPGFTMMIIGGITSIRGPAGWLLRFPSDTRPEEASRRYRLFMKLQGVPEVHAAAPPPAASQYNITINGHPALTYVTADDHYHAN